MSAATATRPVRHAVGRVEEFELDRFRVFDLNGRPVGVVRTPGGFYAVRNRCPHQGADLCAGRVMGRMRPSSPQVYDYDPDARIVICPWHRWEFDLQTGASVEAASGKRAVTYPVEIQDGQVYVLMKGRGR